MKRLIIAIAVIGLFSCGNPFVIQTLQEQSVGQIPCNADHVEVIQHIIRVDGSATWTALCSGHTYNCQRTAGTTENPDSGEVTCSQTESQMPE